MRPCSVDNSKPMTTFNDTIPRINGFLRQSLPYVQRENCSIPLPSCSIEKILALI